MKKRLQGFLVGLIVMFVLFNGFTYAATVGETITVYMNNVRIALDGEIVTTVGDDYVLSNGTTVPYTILYEGTTYVPIRKFCELLEKEIGYDSNTQTVLIGETGAVVENNVWKLVDKKFVDITQPDMFGYYSGGFTDVGDNYWVSYTSAPEFMFETVSSWSDLPTVIRPNEKVSIELAMELGQFSDTTDNSLTMKSILKAYWGTEMIRPYDQYDKPLNKFDLSEDYATNYGDGPRYAEIAVNYYEVQEKVSPMTVYFIAPDQDSSEYLYVVVEQANSYSAGFYQYTYEWQD